MNILGVDYGAKNVGIAIAKDTDLFATPLSTVKNDDDLVNTVLNICRDQKIEKIVLGESTTLSGVDNPIMERIKMFAKGLEEKTDTPVVFQKEILTTQEAKRGQEERKTVDDSAAALILQSYLEQSRK